jgi:hypothetical protein
MSFWKDKAWVTLKGQEGCKKQSVALQSIINKPRPIGDGFLWELKEEKPKQGGTSSLSAQQQTEIELLLLEFDHVFQSPTGLPPRRSRDHAITLVEGQGPVNVRPYRYPHHHKNEIEK